MKLQAVTTRADAAASKYPAMIIGLVMSVVVAVITFIAGGGALTWAAILPVACAALIHPFVASPATLQAAKAEVPPGYVQAEPLLQVGVEHHRDVRGRFVD